MATGLQIKQTTRIITGGYEGETHYTDVGASDWTDMPLSGSATVKYYYHDSGSSPASDSNSSTVEVTIVDSWSFTVEESTNKLKGTLTSTVTGIRRINKVGRPGHYGFNIRLYDGYEYDGGNVVATLMRDLIDYNHDMGSKFDPATPVVIHRDNITINPNSEWQNGVGTVYYRNNWDGYATDGTTFIGNHDPGYDDDLDSIYIDRMAMGTAFRNTLPDKPATPTVKTSSSSSDCDHVNVNAVFTQKIDSRFASQKILARYQINGGSWSAWQTVATNRATGTLTIENVDAGATVKFEYYSQGDAVKSDTGSSTITAPSKSAAPTLTFASQLPNADQVTLTGKVNYSSSGAQKVVYRYKIGDKDWSAWKQTSTVNGTFTFSDLVPNRDIQVQAYVTNSYGLCSNTASVSFTTPRAPGIPNLTKPWNWTQTDTGSCIQVTGGSSAFYGDISYYTSLSGKDRSNAGKTYWSYSVANEPWSEWYELSAGLDGGRITIPCVKYGDRVCVRSYLVGYTDPNDGNGLRGEYTTSCVTVAEKPVDDTPVETDPFVMENQCHSLHYLAELICQEYWAIKDGERTIYTNEEQKWHCEDKKFPGREHCNEDPTLHSMLSRIYRFFGAIHCLICDGLNDSLNHLKRGDKNKYYAWETGNLYHYGEWIAPDTKVTKDSTHLATSDAIYKAIDEFIHTAFCYVGDYDYLTLNPTTLATVKDPKEGDTALVKNGVRLTNQIYTYNGTTWTTSDDQSSGIDDEGYPDRFAMIHVNKESDWTYDGQTVTIPAGSGWYWFNSNWNQLDYNGDGITAEIEDLAKTNMVHQQSTTEEHMKMAVVARPVDGSTPSLVTPSTKTIYFITEEI